MEQGASEKTWRGLYWGPDGAIEQAEERFRQLEGMERTNGLLALASTYYSAAGHAKARISMAALSGGFLWKVRASLCLAKAHRLAKTFDREIGGTENMTPNQLDVFASIFLATRRYKKAMAAIDEGLTRENVSPDTVVLLNMSLAKLCDIYKLPALAENAYDRTRDLWDRIKPTTLVRLHRAMAAHYKKTGRHSLFLESIKEALSIAQKHELNDQETKIMSLL